MPAMSSDSGTDDINSPLLTPVTPSEKMGIDKMLQRYCGEFGSWQLKHFILTNLAWALEAFHTMVMIFADREPEWRCTSSTGCSPLAKNVCGLEPGSWEWTDGLGASTVSEWGLICGEKYKVGLVHSAFFAGCMVGAGVFGHLSDSFLGRKGSLTIVCIINIIFGCLTALSPSYLIYTLLRFITGFSNGGVGLCAFVLSTEPIGPNHRGAVGMFTFYFFSGGIAVLSGIAYIFRSWRALYIASSIPSFLYLVVVIPFISESPRWYLVRGKVDQAMKLMREISQANGKNLPAGVQLVLDDDKRSNSISKVEENKEPITGTLLDVVKLPITRVRLLLAVSITFMSSFVYYGLSLNVVNLDTNLYVNVLLNAAAEMPAFALTAFLLDKYGRKPLGMGTMWFSGIFCLLGSLMNNYGTWKIVRMVCGILGIFGMAGTYNLLFVYTAELFPTVVRNAALGCATQASQMGAILAPLVVVMGGGLPFAVFAACGIIGGMLVFNLPETLNKPLYDTMAGMEDGEKAREDAGV